MHYNLNKISVECMMGKRGHSSEQACHELNSIPLKVLTLSTTEWDLLWEWGHCRCISQDEVILEWGGPLIQ